MGAPVRTGLHSEDGYVTFTLGCEVSKLKYIFICLITLTLASTILYMGRSPTVVTNNILVCDCTGQSIKNIRCAQTCLGEQTHFNSSQINGTNYSNTTLHSRTREQHNQTHEQHNQTQTSPIVSNITTSTTTNQSQSKVVTATNVTNHTSVDNTIKAKSPEETTNLTTEVVHIPNCHGCLQGKVLVSPQRGWICGSTRLGNKMFMLASPIAAAAKCNATFVLPKDEDRCKFVQMLQKVFVGFSSVPLLQSSTMAGWPNIGERGFTAFNPNIIKGKNTTTGGYKQSWKYFDSNVEQKAVKAAFTFTPLYEFISRMFLQKAKSNFTSVSEPIFIGVHMRLGDLFTKQFMTYGYRAANTSFYSTAMKKATSHFNNSKSIIFLVATDSPKLAKDMLKGLEKVYNIYWIGGTANEDLATLTKCNHSIISGGTFGFWAAWLAGGKTFYFSEFAKPGTGFHKGFVSENFYLPSWIPVGWS